MVLTKVITDAKDKITGTPQPFNPMLMMGAALAIIIFAPGLESSEGGYSRSGGVTFAIQVS
jgi:hypothetical protein